MPSGVIFARPGGALIVGYPYGHVGWGFQTSDVDYCIGGVEVAHGQMRHDLMDFWSRITNQWQHFMSSLTPCGIGTRYDMFKTYDVAHPQVDAAMAAMMKVSNTDYELIGQNCMDDTKQILSAYGVVGMPNDLAPADFFRQIPGKATVLLDPWPTLTMDISLYDKYDLYGVRDDLSPEPNGYVADPTCDERPDGLDGPIFPISTVVVRRGFIALYGGENFGGDSHYMTAGQWTNSKDLPWADTTIRSYYASVDAFDPRTLAAAQVESRFIDGAQRKDHAQRLGLPPFYSPQQQRTFIQKRGV